MDQLSEIQTADMPQPPAPTGNARADSIARAEYERQLAAHFERQGRGFQQRGAIPYGDATAQPARSFAPHADDLETLKAVHADAMKRFPGNSQANAIIDQAYRDLHAGKRLDFDALSDALAQATSTAESRALDAALDRVVAAMDADGAIMTEQLPNELLYGYALPPGRWDAAETLRLLKLARDVNATQEQVDAFIAAQEAEQ